MTEKFVISGIGIDIVSVQRFRDKNYSQNKSFYEKLFDKQEIEYCIKFKDPYKHFAGKFAIKEALIKSIPIKIQPHNIITSYKNSKPIVKLKSSKLKNYNFLVSVSHEHEFAIAIIYAQTPKI